MNYYERHLGDYAKQTAMLSMLEDGAYNRLLDRYYATERPIPQDQVYRVTRAKTAAERRAVDFVLKEFFTLSEGCWKKNRCEEEIRAAQSRISAARKNGLSGGRPKNVKNQSMKEPNGFFDGCPGETQCFESGLLAETHGKALQAPSSIKDPPISPKGDSVGQESKPKSKAITLKTYLAQCGEAGEAPIPGDDPVVRYAERIGLPPDYLELAWDRFAAKYVNTSQRQASWPQKFRNAVEGNWYGLWYMNGSGWTLTTAGQQARIARGES